MPGPEVGQVEKIVIKRILETVIARGLKEFAIQPQGQCEDLEVWIELKLKR